MTDEVGIGKLNIVYHTLRTFWPKRVALGERSAVGLCFASAEFGKVGVHGERACKIRRKGGDWSGNDSGGIFNMNQCSHTCLALV